MSRKVSKIIIFVLLIGLFGYSGKNIKFNHHVSSGKMDNEYNEKYTLFVSPDGSDSNMGTENDPFRSISKAAEVAQFGEHVLIKNGTYVESFYFEKSGTSSEPIMFSAETGVIVEGPNSIYYLEAIIYIYNSRYVTFSGFHLKNSNWYGINIENSSHVTIDSCFVENTEGPGIRAYGSKHIIVNNNKIIRAFIVMDSVNTFQVIHNEVYESSVNGDGIRTNGRSSNGIVAYNEVHDNINIGINVDCWNNLPTDIQVYGNILYNNDQGIAVFSHDGGVAQNVKIYNNIIYDNRNQGIIITSWVLNGLRKNISIICNTVVNNGYDSDWGGGITINYNTNLAGAIIRNNIVSGNNYWQIMADYPDTGIICDHNLINGFRNYTFETKGTDFQEGNPGFVDVINNNFALLNTSIAIDAGSSIEAPTEDFVGNKRPYGGIIDIGAFEYIEPIKIDDNTEFQTTATTTTTATTRIEFSVPFWVLVFIALSPLILGFFMLLIILSKYKTRKRYKPFEDISELLREMKEELD